MLLFDVCGIRETREKIMQPLLVVYERKPHHNINLYYDFLFCQNIWFLRSRSHAHPPILKTYIFITAPMQWLNVATEEEMHKQMINY